MSFSVGQRVRVSDRAHPGHHRTPGYLKDGMGEIVHAHGAFTNPETRAYGADGLPRQPLYLVAFARTDLFPGGNGDRVYADVFEHWLEEAG